VSSLYVRQMIEGWLKDPAMTVPYYPTINEEQQPSDATWMTAEFDALYMETLSFCQDEKREEGIVTLVYFAPPGTGDDAVLTTIEADMLTLMAKRDSANRLIIMDRSPPIEYSGGDADEQYSVAIEIDYTFLT